MVFALAESSIQLVPDGTLIFHIIVILTMMWVLNRTLFKPINRILDERERRTKGRSDEAHDVLRRIDEKLTHYERSLRNARTESYHHLEKERLEATRRKQNQLEVVRQEITQLTEEQKAAIQAEAAEAKARLGDEARRLAMNVSAQILKRPLNDFPPTGAHN